MEEKNRRSKKKVTSFLLALLPTIGMAAGLLGYASPRLSPPFIPLKVQLSWIHQTQFVDALQFLQRIYSQ